MLLEHNIRDLYIKLKRLHFESKEGLNDFRYEDTLEILTSLDGHFSSGSPKQYLDHVLPVFVQSIRVRLFKYKVIESTLASMRFQMMIPGGGDASVVSAHSRSKSNHRHKTTVYSKARLLLNLLGNDVANKSEVFESNLGNISLITASTARTRSMVEEAEFLPSCPHDDHDPVSTAIFESTGLNTVPWLKNVHRSDWTMDYVSWRMDDDVHRLVLDPPSIRIDPIAMAEQARQPDRDEHIKIEGKCPPQSALLRRSMKCLRWEQHPSSRSWVRDQVKVDWFTKTMRQIAPRHREDLAWLERKMNIHQSCSFEDVSDAIESVIATESKMKPKPKTKQKPPSKRAGRSSGGSVSLRTRDHYLQGTALRTTVMDPFLVDTINRRAVFDSDDELPRFYALDLESISSIEEVEIEEEEEPCDILVAREDVVEIDEVEFKDENAIALDEALQLTNLKMRFIINSYTKKNDQTSRFELIAYHMGSLCSESNVLDPMKLKQWMDASGATVAERATFFAGILHVISDSVYNYSMKREQPQLL